VRVFDVEGEGAHNDGHIYLHFTILTNNLLPVSEHFHCVQLGRQEHL